MSLDTEKTESPIDSEPISCSGLMTAATTRAGAKLTATHTEVQAEGRACRLTWVESDLHTSVNGVEALPADVSSVRPAGRLASIGR